MPQTFSTTTDRIRRLFEARGSMHYGEGVSQIQHAVQSYRMAVLDGADPEMRVAAFLHDLGHLLTPEDDKGIDLNHEDLAASWLSARGFPHRVADLIALHVSAKRYLAADETYLNGLSDASRRSLELQGGLLSDAERAEFEALPHSADAIKLRRWDDLAKDPSDVSSTLIPAEVWTEIDSVLSQKP